MAKVGRMSTSYSRTDSSSEKLYGSTQVSPPASPDSFDTLRSTDLEQDDCSFAQCCKAAPGCLYKFTIESCINPCQKPTPSTEENELEYLTPTGDNLDVEVMKMKTRLKFHFMNPFEKWKYAKKRRFPWKFILQIASITIVTAQLAMFASSKTVLMDFLQANKKAFAHLFIYDDPSDIDFSGPEVPSPIKEIYTIDELSEQLNYISTQYFRLDQEAVGAYGYAWNVGESVETPHLNLTIDKYLDGEVDPSTRTYTLSPEHKKNTYRILNSTDPINSVLDWSEIEKELTRVLSISLNCTVSSIHIINDLVECFEFDITFEIKNHDDERNIKMILDLDVDTRMRLCDNSTDRILDIDSGVLPDSRALAVDCLAIVISIVSIVLCGRSLLRSLHLSKAVWVFFNEHFQWKLRIKHFLPLFNFWFLGLLVSNGLVLIATITKIAITYSDPDSAILTDIISIILGLAVFGQWCGMLRFFSYFDKYNILLLTIKVAMPSVLRFGVCVGIFYVSFLLLGWLVLGPYHPKFRDPTITSECLFSLLNGDDMFATFEEMSQSSLPAWIFSKLYLYTFISLFIYVVLAVVISLISDTYETLHDHWGNRTRGLLMDFATDQLGRGRVRSGSNQSHHSIVEEDAEDYNLMRDIAVSCEQQPLSEVAPPPSINIQDSSVHLKPAPGRNAWRTTSTSKT